MAVNEITTNFYVGQDLQNTASDEYKTITTSKKMGFTNGNEFTFNGEDYIGYFNFDGKNFYKTKTKEIDNLVVSENVGTDLRKSNKFFDRTIFTLLETSYTLDDLIFKPNEIINKNSINFKLNLLYENFVDLYRFCNISDPLIPTDFKSYAVLSATNGIEEGMVGNTEWEWVSSDVRFISGALDPDLVPLSAYDQNFKDAYNINTLAIRGKKVPEEYTYFVSTSTSIYGYQLDDLDTKFDFVLSATGVSTADLLRFNNITSIAADKENNILYINDKGFKQIYKTDVRTIVNKDRTGIRDFKLLNVIGGEGNEETNFKDNTYIEYGNKNIYVYDDIDKGIKKFSEDFVFKTDYKNVNFFTENEFISMTFNKTFDLLYILTKTYKVIVLNANTMTEIDRYSFDSNPFELEIPLVGFFELPRKIIFSENDSNVYYLQTNKNVYKYFVNTQSKKIERFTIDVQFGAVGLWNTVFRRFSAYEVKWDQLPDFDAFTIAQNGLEVIGNDNNKEDKLILWSNKRLFSFIEDNDTITMLNKTTPNFYKKSEIFIESEFFNNITFNSTIYRHLFNLNLLASNLNKKLLAKFDTLETDGYLRFFDFIELTTKDKISLDMADQKQFFVGVNETLNGNTLNRVINNLFNYQNSLINLVKTERIGKRIPILETVVLDTFTPLD